MMDCTAYWKRKMKHLLQKVIMPSKYYFLKGPGATRCRFNGKALDLMTRSYQRRYYFTSKRQTPEVSDTFKFWLPFFQKSRRPLFCVFCGEAFTELFYFVIVSLLSMIKIVYTFDNLCDSDRGF